MSDSKALFFFESSHISAPDISFWNQLIKRAGTFQEVTILWMSDAPPDALLKALTDMKVAFRLVEAANLLQNEMVAFEGMLKPWFGYLWSRIDLIQDRWFARFSEINFSNPAWFDLLRFTVFYNVLQSETCHTCIAVAGQRLLELVKQACRRNAISLLAEQTEPEQSPVTLRLCLVGWLKNAFTDGIIWLLSRRRKRIHHFANAIYAGFPLNWKQIDNRWYYRYTGKISEYLYDCNYFVTLSRTNRSVHKQIKKLLADWKQIHSVVADCPVVVIESFGSLFDLLRCYFSPTRSIRWFFAWRKLKKSGCLQWQGINVSSLFDGNCLQALFLDEPSARYLERCTKRAIKTCAIDTLYVPVFELVEGRAVVRAANHQGAKTIGLQHGAAGRAHSWRIMLTSGMMASGTASDRSFVPDRIAVEGSQAEAMLKRNEYPAERIIISGAPRLSQFMPAESKKPPSKTVLVLGDLHRPETLFSWVLNALCTHGYTAVFRPHPSRYSYTAAWLKSQHDEVQTYALLSRRDSSLETELGRIAPIAILAGCTGAAVEIAMSGWPVIVVLSNWQPDYSPLTAFNNSRIFCSHNADIVRKRIDLLYQDSAHRAAYSCICRESGMKIVDAVGEAAASRIVNAA